MVRSSSQFASHNGRGSSLSSRDWSFRPVRVIVGEIGEYFLHATQFSWLCSLCVNRLGPFPTWKPICERSDGKASSMGLLNFIGLLPDRKIQLKEAESQLNTILWTKIYRILDISKIWIWIYGKYYTWRYVDTYFLFDFHIICTLKSPINSQKSTLIITLTCLHYN